MADQRITRQISKAKQIPGLGRTRGRSRKAALARPGSASASASSATRVPDDASLSTDMTMADAIAAFRALDQAIEKTVGVTRLGWRQLIHTFRRHPPETLPFATWAIKTFSKSLLSAAIRAEYGYDASQSFLIKSFLPPNTSVKLGQRVAAYLQCESYPELTLLFFGPIKKSIWENFCAWEAKARKQHDCGYENDSGEDYDDYHDFANIRYPAIVHAAMTRIQGYSRSSYDGRPLVFARTGDAFPALMPIDVKRAMREAADTGEDEDEDEDEEEEEGEDEDEDEDGLIFADVEPLDLAPDSIGAHRSSLMDDGDRSANASDASHHAGDETNGVSEQNQDQDHHTDQTQSDIENEEQDQEQYQEQGPDHELELSEERGRGIKTSLFTSNARSPKFPRQLVHQGAYNGDLDFDFDPNSAEMGVSSRHGPIIISSPRGLIGASSVIGFGSPRDGDRSDRGEAYEESTSFRLDPHVDPSSDDGESSSPPPPLLARQHTSLLGPWSSHSPGSNLIKPSYEEAGASNSPRPLKRRKNSRSFSHLSSPGSGAGSGSGIVDRTWSCMLSNIETDQELHAFIHRKWLNDEVVNGFCEFFATHSPRHHMLTSFTFNQESPLDSGAVVAAQQILRLRKELRRPTTLLAVLNKNNTHWYCATVDLPEAAGLDELQIHIYDSYSSHLQSPAARSEREGLEHLVSGQFAACFPELGTHWAAKVEACPQQDNDYDCGIFTILAALSAVTDTVMDPFKLSSLHIRTLRQILASMILNKPIDGLLLTGEPPPWDAAGAPIAALRAAPPTSAERVLAVLHAQITHLNQISHAKYLTHAQELESHAKRLIDIVGLFETLRLRHHTVLLSCQQRLAEASDAAEKLDAHLQGLKAMALRVGSITAAEVELTAALKDVKRLKKDAQRDLAIISEG